MPQPIKNTIRNKPITRKKKINGKGQRTKKMHPNYGTSKLEERFAKEFLDKIGVEYFYQYEMKPIGRFADFRIKPHGPIIEIQGSYWHGDKRIYEERDLNHTQKKSQFVDEIKRKWCARNGIKLYCIWEKDINEDPEEVFNFLKEVLKKYIKENINKKNKRH